MDQYFNWNCEVSNQWGWILSWIWSMGFRPCPKEAEWEKWRFLSIEEGVEEEHCVFFKE